MKLTRYTLPALILGALLISPALALAEENLWDKAKETTSQSWDATQKGIEEATEWSKEKSTDVWNATKEGAADVSEWSRKKAGEAWDATRESTAEMLEALKGRDEKSAEGSHQNNGETKSMERDIL